MRIEASHWFSDLKRPPLASLCMGNILVHQSDGVGGFTLDLTEHQARVLAHRIHEEVGENTRDHMGRMHHEALVMNAECDAS